MCKFESKVLVEILFIPIKGKYFLALSTERFRINDLSVAMNTPSNPDCGLYIQFSTNKKQASILGEMAVSKIGARNVQDEPRTFCCDQKQDY